jgi:hypothetical protein
MQSMVHNEMTTTYGASHVAAVNVVYNTSKLDPLLAKYDKSKGQLEDITDDYIGKLRRGQEIKKRKQVGWGGVHADDVQCNWIQASGCLRLHPRVPRSVATRVPGSQAD